MVTAGASGIGACIATAFAETGAAIHIRDIDNDALADFQKSFPGCQATHADVTAEAQVAALFETQRTRFGGLDVMINCAGIAGPTAGVDKITEQEWPRTIEVNLNGQYRRLHHAVPMLRESKDANIICISSVAGRSGRSAVFVRPDEYLDGVEAGCDGRMDVVVVGGMDSISMVQTAQLRMGSDAQLLALHRDIHMPMIDTAETVALR